MLMHNTYYKYKQQLINSSIIEHKIVDEITTNIDDIYFKFHTFLAKDKHF